MSLKVASPQALVVIECHQGHDSLTSFNHNISISESKVFSMIEKQGHLCPSAKNIEQLESVFTN